jgi:DNA repair photolyase
MRRLPVDNPANRFAETETVYLEGEDAPPAELEVYFDKTGSVLAKNDSPDVGFSYSVNPYRGCFHGCAYCLDGDTPILMADCTTRPLRDLRVGDAIYGTKRRRLVRTTVVAHWETSKPAYRVRLADGTKLVASGEHRLLTTRGWRRVDRLGTQHALVASGAFDSSHAGPLAETADYKRGYLCGMVRGRSVSLVDLAPTQRVRRYLSELALEERDVAVIGARSIQSACAWPASVTNEWRRGFLAGSFDTEGSFDGESLHIDVEGIQPARAVLDACRAFGFDATIGFFGADDAGVDVHGTLGEHLRFAHVTAPTLSKRWELDGLPTHASSAVASVERLHVDMPMFDITTGTGDFIANGVVSHNCFARPTHEYLSFGAGTDFERKIVVKKDAPALLRKALGGKSWRGDLLMFSGVTDCYQPLENKYRLTRGCLEVCVEYNNPVHIITKSPLVERDIDVLVALSKAAHFSIAISLPFVNETHARALEPYVTTPARRLKTIERLAAAGLRVGVSVAPVIPGLSDEDMPDVLAAARSAGASFAGYTLLRLPGHVKDVFESRIREALPDKADRVMSHVRQSRDGKLYDSTFGVRGRGTGPYAEAIGRLFAATSKRLGYESPENREEGSPGMIMGPREDRVKRGGTEQLSLFFR